MSKFQRFLRTSLIGTLALAVTACGGGSSDNVDAGPGGPDGSTVCDPLPVDGDGDTISDEHEGRPQGRDTDDDGTPDWQDADSDDDGISDADEAGDADPCTEPRDTDGDGLPDFRADDSDGNGIPDADEPDGDIDGDGYDNGHDRDDDGDGMFDTEEWGDGATPVDSDGDSTPDYQDTDSDADGVLDRYEGLNDLDEDGIPAYLDDDSDGDGALDTVEGPGGQEPPDDFDDDGAYDFIDLDSDNDGLADAEEDLDGDGVLDPGESSTEDDDTDDDGWLDIVEWAAETDPQDPASGLSEDDFFFVLPIFAPEEEDDLEFSTDIIKADVFIEVDTTGSMGGTITTLSNSLQTVIVPNIALEVPNVAFGSAWFKDFSVSPFGDSADEPFFLTQRITTVVADVQAGINQFSASGGADGPESGMEAFYQAVTGEGVEWDVATAGEVPKFEPSVGFDATRGHGVLGGAGFRIGALPIIIHATDIEYHDAPDYHAAGIDQAHSRNQAVAAANGLGARFIAITSSSFALTALAQISRDTGAVVPPIAWGPTETFCHTGAGGSLVPPDPTGLCPLAYTMNFGGTGVDQALVDGVEALVTFGTIDISAVPVADPYELPAVDTAQFITAITPVPPAPPGSTIDGDVFRDVLPGTPVLFRVHARNTFVESRLEAQLFRVTIRVMGDAVTVLDERDVYVVIPGGVSDP